ncbi:MAG: hypothetical protein MR400_09570 [Clostridiales bacterium]|nr:hypothetical protein [Clostridiales bacterium]
MKKKLCILLLALAALLALTVGAQAADLNTYATARFDQSWPCYSGPGEYYFRANNGKATYGGGGVARVYGVTGSWVMIGYELSNGDYRIGYVEKTALRGMYSVKGQIDYDLSFSSYTRSITSDCSLTDDPVIYNKPILNLSRGTSVTVLGTMGTDWTYVEVTGRSGYMRGFVPSWACGGSSYSSPTTRPSTSRNNPTARPNINPNNYPLYVVESYSPNGYCYLYDQASDVYGRNLGRYNNGATVRVIDYYGGNGYCYVYTSDGKLGYIHDYVLTPYNGTLNRDRYRVYSTNPAGYCYLYDQPSDIKGRNLGRYDNGAYFEMIDWYADDTYAQVRAESTGKYGYVRKTCLVRADSYKPAQAYAYVDSTSPNGYCYLYDQPSDIYGNNLGRYNNGAVVMIIDWNADTTYAKVETSKGKIGYIRKTCLSLY